MRIRDIKEILDADVLTGEDLLDKEVFNAFGADLMSDVLAYVNSNTLLLTGLTNPQVIRTAEMSDVFAIIFVRGKSPSEEILELAKKNGLIVLKTNHILYTACGKLYERGLQGLRI
ncbi:DRTGG domain-containing protein [Abyssisolibacter fermentans]|uniref:DRTGG domain-containing protein n=1 Tax=Abyssisolibacter fermentans TaxID=1766203 RepID=UPI00082B6069|nr:DRTGG domain-containing protein [Abyssisolibacter fermentans]